MSVDFNAVASAIATRFSSANVTAPSGETNIRESTHALPGGVTKEPMVLVYPPTVDFDFGPSLRKGTATFPVRFYIFRIRDNQRNAVLINKWMAALYAQMDGQLHLGLSSYVDWAQVSALEPGLLTYPAGTDNNFHGIEFSVEVHFHEGVSATA